MKESRRSQLLRRLGGALGLAAAGVVVWRMQVQGAEMVRLLQSTRLLFAVLIGSLAMGAAGLLLSEAWRRLVRWHSGCDLGFRAAHELQGGASIAKYLPGNVMHLVGRHALGRARGVGHAALAGSAVHEAGSLVTVAACVALLGLALHGDSAHLAFVLPVLALGLSAAALPPLLVARRDLLPPLLARLIPGAPLEAGARRRSDLAAVPALHFGFFLVGGIVLAHLLAVTADQPAWTQLAWAALAFGIAWTVGFATPGAPAGLGVREALLVGLLSPGVGESAALGAALAFRLVTLAGDLLTWASAWAWTRPRAS